MQRYLLGKILNQWIYSSLRKKYFLTVVIFGMSALFTAMLIWQSYVGLYPSNHQPLRSQVPQIKQLLRMRAENSQWINDNHRPGQVVYSENFVSAIFNTSDSFENSSSHTLWLHDMKDVDTKNMSHNIRTGYGMLFNDSATNESLICPEKTHVVTTTVDRFKRKIPKDLYNMAPMVFDSVPSQFMKGLRNPCWKTAEQSAIVCLPSFFLAGMPKSGTTDLWYKIVRHPNIIGTEKEPHWWTRKETTGMNILNYSNYYTVLSRKIKKNLQGTTRNIVGDGSASTFWDNKKWKKYFPDACNDVGPPYIIADVIHAVLPKAKILVIFRNPSDRLYSDYVNWVNFVRTPQAFHDDVLKSISKFNHCITQASHRTCAYSFLSYTRLHIGLYSVFVRDWLKVFLRDQLMFLRVEDWHMKCPEILPKIFTFLELKSQSKQDILTMCSAKRSNRTKNYSGAMFNKTRRILDEFYATTRHELAEILNDKSFLWE